MDFCKAVVTEKVSGLVVFQTKQCTGHYTNIFGEEVIQIGTLQKMVYDPRDYWISFYAVRG